jgi:hypothetical protein
MSSCVLVFIFRLFNFHIFFCPSSLLLLLFSCITICDVWSLESMFNVFFIFFFSPRKPFVHSVRPKCFRIWRILRFGRPHVTLLASLLIIVYCFKCALYCFAFKSPMFTYPDRRPRNCPVICRRYGAVNTHPSGCCWHQARFMG